MGRIRQTMDNAVINTRKTVLRVKEKYTFLNDLGIGFWVLLLFFFIVGVFSIVYIKSMIQIIVSDYGYLGIFFTSIITDMLVQPVGPDVPLVLGTISGLLNPWNVLFFVLMGSYLAMIFSYYIGRNIGAAGIEKIMGKKSNKKIDKYQLEGKWFMFIGALTPVPYIPYLAGLWQFTFLDMVFFVVLPRTIRFFAVFSFLYFLGITLV
jgi:membrane protein YqaA with SNARE-associated domain